ncbi:transcriptional adapter 2-alpha isoform X2 [Hydra vulgaris]|uniref:Transcriptional adapter n=1 Tax=Hydra vulgaris TaxID=6087 RepID=A0ABM4CNJ1_HYDVU
MDDCLCPLCSNKLKEPYIHCEECGLELCLKCFAKGSETTNHKSNHRYIFKSYNFNLFDDKWTAAEELHLLEATREYGFGNWSEVSEKMRTKTKDDCEIHYLKYYINEPHSLLPKFKKSKELIWRRPIYYRASKVPPRPEENTDDPLCLIGYMAARGDFLLESDNFAECDLKDVDIDINEDDELIMELNLAVVDIYFRRLNDREVKKMLLRDYGMLDISDVNGIVFSKSRIERDLREVMKRFAMFMNPDEHEKLVQSLLYQKQLENQIRHLQEYRSMGLSNMKDARIYEKLKQRRKKLKPNREYLSEVLLHKDNPLACQIWLQRQINGKNSSAPLSSVPLLNRKACPPLDISNLPGTDKLTPAERDLCSNIRLLPTAYLHHRNILQRESFYQNGLKLQTARSLLKIDVNKTKRLFEFCVEQGYIQCQAKNEENNNDNENTL